MKKGICLFLALILTAGCFSGCSGGGSTENNAIFNQETAAKLGDLGGLELPLAEEPVTIEWAVTTDHENFNTSWFAEKLREATGVDVQFRVVPKATAEEKMSVWIASKDLPDIIPSATKQVADDLATQGAIAAVEDYIDVLPNFKATFVDNKENDWIFKSYAAPDGKLYGFYGFDWSRDVNHGVLYRKDIFDKHNIPMWNGPDEFYSALKKLKELYPSSTPFTSKNKEDLAGKLAVSWGIKAYEPYYDEADNTWKYSDTDPKFKSMLDYLKKLYDEKLLDQEFLTLTQAAWTSKMTQANEAFVTWDWIGRLDTFAQQAASSAPGYDLRYGNPIGPEQTVIEADQLCWARYVAKSKNEEISFKVLDFLLSPAGAELLTMGIEGETYVLDDKGMAKYTEFTYDDAENTPDMTKLEQKYGMFTEGIYLKFDRRSAYFKFTEKEQEAQNYVKDPEHIEPLDPVLAFTAEEQEKINDYLAKLSKAGREFLSKYILSAETGDAAWNAWIKKANELGAQELINIYNEAQKRYDSQ